jgi:hypothetical protein
MATLETITRGSAVKGSVIYGLDKVLAESKEPA